MNAIVGRTAIPALTPEELEKVQELEARVLELPQVDIETHHVFHAGLYGRTIVVRKGVLLTGVIIKRSTLLIVSGEADMHVGEKVVRLSGYHVLSASAGRKQAFFAREDTWMTMLFATEALTTEEAEAEFTDESERLMSRHGVNHVTITGE